MNDILPFEQVIAEDEFTSLADHDRRYHDNNYRGGKCLVRETMASGDNSDAALNRANEREAALWVANRQERKIVEDAVVDTFKKISKRNGCLITMSEPDDKGVSRLMIWGPASKLNDADVPEQDLVKMLKGLGYDASDYSVMVEKDETKRGNVKEKLCFVIDAKKKNAIRLAEEKNDMVTVVRPEEPSDMTEEKKNELLKRYGIKVSGGKYVGRTADDARRDRIRRYLGIVGDFEGQSNREDKESGVWEKRRLASLKRAQEERAREAEEAKKSLLEAQKKVA